MPLLRSRPSGALALAQQIALENQLAAEQLERALYQRDRDARDLERKLTRLRDAAQVVLNARGTGDSDLALLAGAMSVTRP